MGQRAGAAQGGVVHSQLSASASVERPGQFYGSGEGVVGLAAACCACAPGRDAQQLAMRSSH